MKSAANNPKQVAWTCLGHKKWDTKISRAFTAMQKPGSQHKQEQK